MDYMLKRIDVFTRFLDDGRICLSNNISTCPFSELHLQHINPSTSPNELNTTLTPHSMIHGDACFAYFNKIWGIPGRRDIPPLTLTTHLSYWGGTGHLGQVCVTPRTSHRNE